MCYCSRCQKTYENELRFCPTCGKTLTLDSQEMPPLTTKNIEKASLFSFLAGLFYQLYWLYQLIRNTRYLQKKYTSPVWEFLCYVLIPFYKYYWWLSRTGFVKDRLCECGKKAVSNQYIFCFCSFIGIIPYIEIITYALFQHDFNMLAEVYHVTTDRSERNKKKRTLPKPQKKVPLAPMMYTVTDVNNTLLKAQKVGIFTVKEEESSVIDQWTVEINEAIFPQTYTVLRHGVQNIWRTNDESFVFRFETALDAQSAMRYLKYNHSDAPYKEWVTDCDNNIALFGEKKKVELIKNSLYKE